MKFCSIASGSDGNCIFVSSGSTKILIDSGLSGITIQKSLLGIGVEPSEIDAIFITHEHKDHIHGAGILSRRFSIPIYACEQTWFNMNTFIGPISEKNKHYIYRQESCFINDMKIVPFEIPHDAISPVGYTIFTEGCKISVATDIGHITDTIKQNISDSDILLIESNHDLDMLKNGPYPYVLKKRIMGGFGHLSNDACGHLLVDIMSEKLKYIFLGHLSRENNNPSLAYKTVSSILTENNIDIGGNLQLSVANRGIVSLPVVI
ncbi:MAG: MBL fold metallo-hydrolase [Clostridiales bacterium]|nr:MBL fold metallo-hydrolase [Clostridiales bacterium]